MSIQSSKFHYISINDFHPFLLNPLLVSNLTDFRQIPIYPIEHMPKQKNPKLCNTHALLTAVISKSRSPTRVYFCCCFFQDPSHIYEQRHLLAVANFS
jgi:hypothetical protein